jgi:Chemoreceptor zinc-binding domain
MKTLLFAALSAHVAWKEKLRMAIDTGIIDPPSALIRQDNLCIFGKWLYGADISEETRASARYDRIRKIHAEFHQSAAAVAMLAEVGEKDQARQMMATDQPYGIHSNNIRREILSWIAELPD